MKITRRQIRQIIKEALLAEGEYGQSRRNPFGSCEEPKQKLIDEFPGHLVGAYGFPLPVRKVKYAQAVEDAKKKAKQQFVDEFTKGLSQEVKDSVTRGAHTRVVPYDPKVGKICVLVTAHGSHLKEKEK